MMMLGCWWTFLRARPFRAILLGGWAVAIFSTLIFGMSELHWTILRALVAALACGVAVTYTPAACTALRSTSNMTPGQGLAVGIWLSALGIAGRLGLFSIFPPEHHLPAFALHAAAMFLWSLALGALIALGASNGIERNIPPRAMVILGSVVAATLSVVALISIFDAHW